MNLPLENLVIQNLFQCLFDLPTWTSAPSSGLRRALLKKKKKNSNENLEIKKQYYHQTGMYQQYKFYDRKKEIAVHSHLMQPLVMVKISQARSNT